MSKSRKREASRPLPVQPFNPRVIAELEQEEAEMSRALLARTIGAQICFAWWLRLHRGTAEAFIRLFLGPLLGEHPDEWEEYLAGYLVLWKMTSWYTQLDLSYCGSRDAAVECGTAESVNTLRVNSSVSANLDAVGAG